jgi:hypothetical protein
MSRLSAVDLNILRGASRRGGSAFGGITQTHRQARQPANTKDLKRAEKEAERQRQFELQKIAAQSDASQQEAILSANMRAAETAFRAGNEFQLQANAEQAAYQRARAAAKDDRARQAIDNQFRERMQNLEQRQRLELGQFEAGVQADRDGRLFGQQTQRDQTQQGYTQNNAMLQAGLQADRDGRLFDQQVDRDGRLFDQQVDRDQFNVDSQRDRDGRLFGQSLQQGEIDFQRQGIRDDRLQGFTQDNARLNFDLNSQQNNQEANLRRRSLQEDALMKAETRRAEMANQAQVQGRQYDPEQQKAIRAIESQKEEIDRKVASGQMRPATALRAKLDLENRAITYGPREQIQTPQQKLDGLFVEHPDYGAFIVGQDDARQVQTLKTNPEMEKSKFEAANRKEAIDAAIKFAGMIDPSDEAGLQNVGKMLERTYGFNPFEETSIRLLNKSKEKEPQQEFSDDMIISLRQKILDNGIDSGKVDENNKPIFRDPTSDEIEEKLNDQLDLLRRARTGKLGTKTPFMWTEDNTPPEGFSRSGNASPDVTQSAVSDPSFATFNRDDVPPEVMADPMMQNMMDVASGYADTPDGPAVDAAVDTLLMLRSKSGELTPQEELLGKQAMQLLESLK